MLWSKYFFFSILLAPGGVAAPTIVILDYQSVEVIWQEPARSNGEIISYTIHMPEPRVYIGNPNITSYTVDGLVPYTTYSGKFEFMNVGVQILEEVLWQELANNNVDR